MKIKLFYGWYIVAAGLVLAAYNSALFLYGWSAFVNPIIATFGWSMAQIALASSLRGAEAGVFNPIWGVASDRYSPKKLMRFGTIGTALGILFLSQTKNLFMYYAGFLIMGLGSSLVTSILPQTVIARWFRKDFGKASGLYAMGVGLGGVSVPLVVIVVDKLGWQTTLLYSAIIFLIVGLSLSFVFRSRPEDYGMFPDGKAPVAVSDSERGQSRDFGTSVREAIKTRAFWHIALVTFFQFTSNSVIMLHAIPYLTSMGITRTNAGAIVSLYTTLSLFMRIPMGMLSDVFKKSYVIAISLSLQITGIFIFWLISGSSPFWLRLLFGIAYGFGISGILPLRPPILREYFGTKNFGTIFALSSIFQTLATVISQPLVGWVYDTYHDYRISFLVIIALGVAALIAILTIPAAAPRMT
ncbi:MAG: MFS transporter, partial [Dehalococcoidales bacterium]|nr:MFS transporter [Dehalococcoidales bacterium]